MNLNDQTFEGESQPSHHSSRKSKNYQSEDESWGIFGSHPDSLEVAFVYDSVWVAKIFFIGVKYSWLQSGHSSFLSLAHNRHQD